MPEQDKPQTIGALRKALRNLTLVDPLPVDFEAYSAEVEGKRGDRGPAILLAATVENALDTAIMRMLGLDDHRKRWMFSSGGPAGDFSKKIMLGHALNIYGAETRTNLDSVREIRNAFAHAKTPLSFRTPEVDALCSSLKLPEGRFGGSGVPVPAQDGYCPSGIERYQIVCNGIGGNLRWWSLEAILKIELTALSVSLPQGYTIITATRPPFP